MLYLTEPIDEPALNNISEFGDFKFVDVTREDLDLGDIAEDEKKKVRIHTNLGSLSAADLSANPAWPVTVCSFIACAHQPPA